MKIKTLDELAEKIPRYSYSPRHRPAEPINLVILGSLEQINQRLSGSGWYIAEHLNPWSLLKALFASLANSAYPAGPVSWSYIASRRFSEALEHPTRSGSFRRRHHLRIWKTAYSLKSKPVWIGTISYDRSAGLYKNHLLPTHHIAPNLRQEEDYFARSAGIAKPRFITLGSSTKGRISNGDDYLFDGRAIVIDLADSQ